jgi:hypothetical protein
MYFDCHNGFNRFDGWPSSCGGRTMKRRKPKTRFFKWFALLSPEFDSIRIDHFKASFDLEHIAGVKAVSD